LSQISCDFFFKLRLEGYLLIRNAEVFHTSRYQRAVNS